MCCPVVAGGCSAARPEALTEALTTAQDGTEAEIAAFQEAGEYYTVAVAGPGTVSGQKCTFPFMDEMGGTHSACALGGSPNVPGSNIRPYCYGALKSFGAQ